MEREPRINPARIPSLRNQIIKNSDELSKLHWRMKPDKDPTDDIIAELLSYPRASHEENVSSALAISSIDSEIREYCRYNNISIRSLRTEPVLSPGLESLVFTLHLQVTKLASGNLGLIASELRKFQRAFPEYSPEQCLSAGYLGLYSAAVNWKPWGDGEEKTPQNALRFSTYAVSCIHWSIHREINDLSANGLNENLYQESRKFNRNSEMMTQYYKSEPTYMEELLFNYARKVRGGDHVPGIDFAQKWQRRIDLYPGLDNDFNKFAKKHNWIKATANVHSLDQGRTIQYRDSEGEVTSTEVDMSDFLTEDNGRITEDLVVEKQNQYEIRRALERLEGHLPALHYQVMLDHNNGATLKELGRKYHFSPERIRQIIAKSHRKARHVLQSSKQLLEE